MKTAFAVFIMATSASASETLLTTSVDHEVGGALSVTVAAWDGPPIVGVELYESITWTNGWRGDHVAHNPITVNLGHQTTVRHTHAPTVSSATWGNAPEGEYVWYVYDLAEDDDFCDVSPDGVCCEDLQGPDSFGEQAVLPLDVFISATPVDLGDWSLSNLRAPTTHSYVLSRISTWNYTGCYSEIGYGDFRWVGDIGWTITHVAENCRTDIDVSGETDADDLFDVLAFWGACSGECPPDVDDDGMVGFSDLQAVLSYWGACP